MSVKQVQIVTPGGNLAIHVPVEDDTTAADVLQAAGLGEGFVLSSADGRTYFQPSDKLSPVVQHEQTLFANPWAEVGSDLLFVSALPGLAPLVLGFVVVVIVVRWRVAKQRRADASVWLTSRTRVGHTAHRPPYWQQCGWRQSGADYTGSYQALHYNLPGRIRFSSSWNSRFEVLAPESLVNACGEHRRCFVLSRGHGRGNSRWYRIHFNRRPSDVSSGILAIQQMLSRGVQQIQGELA